ncbi:MAG TPA: hypothetical protein DCY07_08095 [Rhodospirillaceae bacterium]|nr:hypothetical protein [Rhodospirillaceae bacterium]
MKHKLLKLFLSGTIVVSLTACSSGDTYFSSSSSSSSSTTYPYVRLSPSPPPPKQIEAKPVATEPMLQIWRPGYWYYDGTSFNWVEGQFMNKPEPTAAWTAERWERRAYGWAFVPGHWQ